MLILWLCILVPSVLGQVSFGSSYLKNSLMCRQWSCINLKLGLNDSLPSKELYSEVITSLLPAEWHNASKSALDTCYGNRTRRYTNSCPGQALMHCLVDNLIANCPDDKLLKDDGCSPVSSLAANNYMFSQSRYANLQKNIPLERRPSWFLQHYFRSKCCQLPELFNSTTLQECGFEITMFYHTHDAQLESERGGDRPHLSSNQLNASASHLAPLLGKAKPNIVDTTKTGNFVGVEENEAVNDPLDCCDLKEFVAPEWREECGFRLSWSKKERLVIHDLNAIPDQSTTTESAEVKRAVDAKIVPQKCEQETCVFRKLGIVSQTGEVDKLAFSRLLDAMTAKNPRWVSAKARVDTKCLSKPITVYEDECEINKVLACTYDVLTENCPDAKKEDPCKHSSCLPSNIMCQISSSKFRPRNRRSMCNVPDFVDPKVVKECGLDAIMVMTMAPENPKPRRGWGYHYRNCKKDTPAATCVMRKMDVYNKYDFMDYFKTKERLHTFCQGPWYPMRTMYMAAFSSTPLYKEHCSSTQQLLNILDTMLVTCPISKKRRGANCRQIFADLTQSLPGYEQRINNTTLEALLSRFEHMFLPVQVPRIANIPKRTVDNPRYNFNFGILDTMKEPEVSIIDVKPKPITSTEKPLILTPVYQSLQRPGKYFDPAWRRF